MKRIFLITIFFLLTFFSFGQKYLTADIKAKAELLMKNFIPDSIFTKYCTYDTTSNYYYWDKDICIGEKLTNTETTKGQFIDANIIWNVCIHYPLCPILKEIKGRVSIVLNNNMQLSNTPGFEFIPSNYWSNKTCDFMSKESATYLAKQQNLEKGIDCLEASIDYNFEEQQYCWYVSQTLEIIKKVHSGRSGNVPYEVKVEELVIINAINGKIVHHEIYQIGIVM